MKSLAFYTVAVGVDEVGLIRQNMALAKRFGVTVFTDRRLELPPCFEQKRVKTQHANPRVSSRYWKLLHFSDFETDYSVYFDANIRIDPDRIAPLQSRAAQGVEIGVFQHDRRRRIYDEILYCYALGKLSVTQLLSSIRFVRYWTLPVFQGGVIMRRTRSTLVEQAMIRWWELLHTTNIERDQITGPIALDQIGLDWMETKFDGIVHSSDFSIVTPHQLSNFTPAGAVRRGDPLQRILARLILS
jgi:hypothetical protein